MRTDSVRMLEFAQHGDERGHLVVVEGMKDIPFEIKRVFTSTVATPTWSAAAMPIEGANLCSST